MIIRYIRLLSILLLLISSILCFPLLNKDFHTYSGEEFVYLLPSLNLFFLALLSVAFFIEFRDFIKNINKIGAEECIYFLLPFLITIFTSSITSAQFYLWGDELYQAEDSFKHPIFAAIQQHQPPVSYFLGYLFNKISGETLASIRVPFILFYSLSMGILPIILKRITNSYIPGVIAFLLLTSNYLFIRYSFEARPQSVALLFLFLFLNDFLNLQASKLPIKKDFIRISVSSTLLLLSIGFQPIFIVFPAFLALTIRFRKNFLSKLILSFSVPIFCFIIFLIPIVLYGPPRVMHSHFSNLLNPLSYVIPNIYLFLPNILSYCFFYVLLFAICLLCFFNPLRSLIKLKASHLYGLSFIFIFSSFISYNFYANMIKWPFSAKYLYLPNSIAYIIIALIIYNPLKRFITHSSKFKTSSLIVVLILFSFLSIQQSNLSLQLLKNNWVYADGVTILNNLIKFGPSQKICLNLNLNEMYCLDVHHAQNYLKLNSNINLFDFDWEKFKNDTDNNTKFAFSLIGPNDIHYMINTSIPEVQKMEVNDSTKIYFITKSTFIRILELIISHNDPNAFTLPSSLHKLLKKLKE